jgi:hypothetical protein
MQKYLKLYKNNQQTSVYALICTFTVLFLQHFFNREVYTYLRIIMEYYCSSVRVGI